MKSATIIPLDQFLSDVTDEEREIIEEEKKNYYKQVDAYRKSRKKQAVNKGK